MRVYTLPRPGHRTRHRRQRPRQQHRLPAVDAGRRHRPLRRGRLHGGDHGGGVHLGGALAPHRVPAPGLRRRHASMVQSWMVDATRKTSSIAALPDGARERRRGAGQRGNAVGVHRRGDRPAAHHPCRKSFGCFEVVPPGGRAVTAGNSRVVKE
ncbi:MAG: hypothetical protein MZW92_43565 [Comamonadaceae bacterium]|nr:hypothetical protein [Comamonadaceae bacterium]